MGERAVRTRRKPGGGKRRAQAYLPNRLPHPSGHETRPLRFTGHQTFLQERTSLHVSPRGEAKCVRGRPGRDASRLARAGVLEQYVEHGKQAQRSPGGRIACFDRRVVRNAGSRFLRTLRYLVYSRGYADFRVPLLRLRHAVRVARVESPRRRSELHRVRQCDRPESPLYFCCPDDKRIECGSVGGSF